MANKKNFWYVLVFTENGPKYVTDISEHHMAHWNECDVPLEMNKAVAQDIATGLLFNFFNAVTVWSSVSISHQPYMYEKGSFTFNLNSNKEEK